MRAFSFVSTETDAQDGEIDDTLTAGSADGVSWAGVWNGQFFGPSVDADEDPIAPSGVAGQFWAETNDVDTGATDADAADNDGMPATAGVGAFGATKDE